MSRAMLVTVLYRLSGSPDVFQPSSFTDVKQGAWYDIPGAWAVNHGIVQGDGKGHFRPDDPVTREQMAAILTRFIQYYNL